MTRVQKRNETFKSSASRTSGYMAGPRRLRKQGETAGQHTASLAVCCEAFRPTVRPNRWAAMYPFVPHSTLSVAGSPSEKLTAGRHDVVEWSSGTTVDNNDWAWPSR